VSLLLKTDLKAHPSAIWCYKTFLLEINNFTVSENPVSTKNKKPISRQPKGKKKGFVNDNNIHKR